jgi:hypothetical protein
MYVYLIAIRIHMYVYRIAIRIHMYVYRIAIRIHMYVYPLTFIGCLLEYSLLLLYLSVFLDL